MQKALRSLLDKLSRFISSTLNSLGDSDQRRNNTEYKHLEGQLKTLSIAVEQSPSTIVVTDTSGRIEYVNPKFTQLTGYTYEEAIGQNPHILKTDKTPPGVYECLWKTITSGKEWRGEFCNKKKNGEFYWESASISPVKNGEGTITHFVAVKEDITERKQMEEKLKLFNEYLEQRVTMRTEELREKNVDLVKEITERKRAEKELRESEEKFRKITSSAYDTIIMMDNEGEISFWNEAAERMFGRSREEVVGKDLHKLIVPERYYDAFQKGMKGFRQDGTGLIINKSLVLPGLRRDGTEFFADHSFSSVKLRGKWHAISIIRDITERRRAEEQIKAALKEKEVLLAEVHHRVKNNLQIISSLLDMSSMQTQNQETIELFAESRNRVEAMSLIHSQLYESERFNEIDMERHIHELSENLLRIYSKEKTITLDIKSSNVYLPVTLAVPCALVLNELISNSLKHAYIDGQQGVISISMQQSNDGATLVKIKDDGVGISEEIDIEKTNSLGLKLVRNIVNKQLNGTMKIVRNKGTEVVLEFNTHRGTHEKGDGSRR